MSDISIGNVSGGGIQTGSIFSGSGSAGGSVDQIQAQIQMLQVQLLELQTTASESSGSSSTSSTTDTLIKELEKRIQALEKKLSEAMAKERTQSSDEKKSTSTKGSALVGMPSVTSAISEGADKMSKFQAAVSNMSDSEKSELSALLKKAQSQIESGDLDADSLVDGASDELKNALSSYGVDLKGTLEDLQGDYQQGQSQSSVDYSQDLGMVGSSNGAPKAGGLMRVLIGIVEKEDGSASEST